MRSKCMHRAFDAAGSLPSRGVGNPDAGERERQLAEKEKRKEQRRLQRQRERARGGGGGEAGEQAAGGGKRRSRGSGKSASPSHLHGTENERQQTTRPLKSPKVSGFLRMLQYTFKIVEFWEKIDNWKKID